MERVKILVDWCDKNFCASTDDDRIGGSVVATHRTYDGVIEALHEALSFHIEGCLADGDELPNWLVEGEYDLEVDLSVSALLRRSEQFTSYSAISRASGINVQQLSHYANGIKHPRKEQRERIVQGLHQISNSILAMI